MPTHASPVAHDLSGLYGPYQPGTKLHGQIAYRWIPIGGQLLSTLRPAALTETAAEPAEPTRPVARAWLLMDE